MRTVAILLAATVALATTAVSTPAATVPKLHVVSTHPLVVQGVGFRTRERVVVTALTAMGPRRVVVRATEWGRLRATLGLVNQPCGDAFAVRAVGAGGSRAWVDASSRPCVPPPID